MSKDDEIRRAARWVAEADALLITAGAGMGIDSGLPDFRGPGGFWRIYPALGKAGIALSFAHGHGNPGKCNEHFSYDHQGSYGDKHGRSLYASMYAIIKIAQQAQWHKK